MISVVVNKQKKKLPNWCIEKHPMLIKYADGSIFLTIACKTEEELRSMGSYERDAICIASDTKAWIVGKTYPRMNLEDCELFDGTITLTNTK